MNNASSYDRDKLSLEIESATFLMVYVKYHPEFLPHLAVTLTRLLSMSPDIGYSYGYPTEKGKDKGGLSRLRGQRTSHEKSRRVPKDRNCSGFWSV